MSKEATKKENQQSILQGPRPFVVEGTGNAAIDVPAVQSAVDNASADGPTRIDLKGRFVFDKSVTIKGWAAIYGLAFGKRAVIEGGRVPFVVAAGNKLVSINGVHFVRPEEVAIKVQSANGLKIVNCKIEQVQTVPAPVPAAPGVTFPVAGGIVSDRNQIITGDVSIVGNDIDIGVTDPVSRTFGIQLTAGNATTRADVTVSGNKVRNVTAHGIVLREIAGTAVIKENDIDIGSVGGVNTNLPDNFVDAIMVQGAKPLVYTVTDNIINCGYENSAGIRLQSTTAEPIKQATISKNQIKMSLPAGAVGGEESAGIELRRNCETNNVSDNTVKGQARAVLAVLAGIVGTANLVPKLNTFTGNTHANFTATKADVLVGPAVDGTTVSSSTGGTKLTAGSLNTNVSPNYQEI